MYICICMFMYIDIFIYLYIYITGLRALSFLTASQSSSKTAPSPQNGSKSQQKNPILPRTSP